MEGSSRVESRRDSPPSFLRPLAIAVKGRRTDKPSRMVRPKTMPVTPRSDLRPGMARSWLSRQASPSSRQTTPIKSTTTLLPLSGALRNGTRMNPLPFVSQRLAGYCIQHGRQYAEDVLLTVMLSIVIGRRELTPMEPGAPFGLSTV